MLLRKHDFPNFKKDCLILLKSRQHTIEYFSSMYVYMYEHSLIKPNLSELFNSDVI